MMKTMRNIGAAVILSVAVATPVLAQGYAPPSQQHYNYDQQTPPNYHSNQSWGSGPG
jgi:hypothetical protein